MTVSDLLYHRILGNSEIVAYVGDRIDRGFRVQAEALPAITFFRVDMVPQQSASGRTHTERVRFQVDVWATKQSTAEAIAELLKKHLDGWSTGGESQSSNCFLESENCSLEDDGTGDTEPIGRVQQDYVLWTYAS